MVKVGDVVPDLEVLTENAPSNKVNLATELKSGKGVIIGVPAAFSPTCTASHIPGYIGSPKLKDAGRVFVVSVNDAFVMKAWGDSLDPGAKSGIRFLADPQAKFSEALDLTFDGTAIFGQPRGKRYAITTEDGKITTVNVEPEVGAVDLSAAEKVLV